jgi:hypothetical protein
MTWYSTSSPTEFHDDDIAGAARNRLIRYPLGFL